jgi:hypothetical protein
MYLVRLPTDVIFGAYYTQICGRNLPNKKLELSVKIETRPRNHNGLDYLKISSRSKQYWIAKHNLRSKIWKYLTRGYITPWIYANTDSAYNVGYLNFDKSMTQYSVRLCGSGKSLSCRMEWLLENHKEGGVIGIDTECDPFRPIHGVDTIQLATESRCLIITTGAIHNGLGIGPILSVLYSYLKKYTLVGYDVLNDTVLDSVSDNPTIDLQTMATFHPSMIPINHVGLKGLVLLCTGVFIDKTHTLSAWGQFPLTLDAIKYASLDALMCVKTYNCLTGSKTNQTNI